MLNIKAIKSAFAQQTVLVIGDIVLDRYFDGTAERMSPRFTHSVLWAAFYRKNTP